MTDTASRTYDGTNRRAAADRNHQRIAEHALGLFVTDGYAATTIDAIAEAAGVSPQTIYAAFGSKKRLLEYLVVSAVNDPVRVDTQDWMFAALSAPGLHERVRAFAEGSTRLLERTADVFAVLYEAKGTDPDLAALWQEGSQRRHGVMSAVVNAAVNDGMVEGSTGSDLVVDALWAMTSPELFRLFINHRSWTTTQYRDWLERHAMLEMESLGAMTAARGGDVGS